MPDIAGQQMREAGQAMQRAGSEVSRIALHLAQQANETRADAALTEYVRADTDLRLEALSLKGNDAVNRPDGKNLPDEFVERANKAASEIEGRLENAAQREAFRRRVTPMQDSMYQRLAVHRVDQERAYAGEQRKATIDTAIYRGGVLWGDKEEVQRSEDTIRLMVEQGIEADGVAGDPQIREARMLAELSPLHSAVINGMADAHRVDLAREYYQRNSASMTLQARDRAMQLLETADFEERTQEISGGLYAKHGGNAAAAIAEAREKLSGKEEDAVINRLKGLDADRVAFRERAQSDAADAAWRIYANDRGMDNIPPSLLAAMDGRDIEAMRRTAAAESGGNDVKTDSEAYYYLTMMAADDPQQFAATDLRRFYDKLSPADRNHFANAQATLLGKTQDHGVATAQQQIAATIKLLGLVDKRAGLFAQEANKALDAAQQDAGRKLTQEERQKTIDWLASDASTRAKFFGIDMPFGASSRVFEAEAAGLPYTVKFSDADKRKARSALERRGVVNPTDEQVDAVIRAVRGVK
ncbi:MAG: hypothetical protein H3C57_00670 [Gammaproteobacteria bacterium]|nr:hypothetical protein [Gammaproteobacteria bacterium]